jgi:toluene monooxygenase system ferredoxin subunit
MLSFCRAASIDDLWIGEVKSICVRGKSVLLANVEGRVRAYENRCGHKGLPLHDGAFDGCVVTCSAHGWQYNLATGHGVNPESARLLPYAVKIEDGEIWIDLDGEPSDAPR